jgi:RNA polymerase sigma-70 factor (ECF subfamily)
LKIGQFDPARSFLTWLFTIARHKWIDRCRVARPPATEPPPEQADLDDPATLLIRCEEGRNLWAVARQILPDLQFQALWLKYAEDLSVRDVARVLRRTQTHVKVLLFRARIALGRELDAACDAQQPGPVERPATATSPARAVAASSRTAPMRVNLGFNLRA